MNHTTANLEYLAHSNPEAAADLGTMVQEVQTFSYDPVSEAHVEPSRSGAPSMWVMPRDSTTARWLHSRFDPMREAREQAKSYGLSSQVEGVVVLGSGLLHLVETLIETYPSLRGIAVIDASPRVLEACLAHRNLEQLSQKRRLWLLTAPQPKQLTSHLISVLRNFIEGDLAIVHHQPSCGLKPEWYSGASAAVDSALRSVAVDLATSDEHSELLQQNLLSNLPAWLDASGAGSLIGEDRPFQGRAAWLAAAGPSLDDHVGHLAEAQQAGGLVICAATCARQVIEAGCTPDLVCSLDPIAVSASYLAGLTSESAPRLLSVSHAAPALVSGHPWKLRFLPFAQEPLLAPLVPAMGPRAAVEPGATAGHLMYDMARALGCDPIVLVGHDLAFPSRQTHASGVTSPWGGDLERLDQKLVSLPRINGQGNVPSLPSFGAFITDFERRAHRDGNLGLRMINTSPAGALIAGFQHLPPTEALAECQTISGPSAANLLDAAGAADRARASARRSAGKAQLLAMVEMLGTLTSDLEAQATTLAPKIMTTGDAACLVAAEAVLGIFKRPAASLLDAAFDRAVREDLSVIRAAETPILERAAAMTSFLTSMYRHARALGPRLETAANQIDG